MKKIPFQCKINTYWRIIILIKSKIKPCKCRLCDRVFMKSYEEDTASMLNKYILGNYYTHILVSFWREIKHLNAVHVTEFSKSVRLKTI